MKISLNWLKKYVKIPESVSNEELIRLIGSRLVEVEGVIDETHKYDNIYIVRVETCEKIPDTHLTLCQINVGDSGLVQVVCGAPNVREGMLAVWIAPGAIVPASVHEDAPFVIGKRKMQGYESNGMLAGADELDFGEDHSGIVEIEPETAVPGDKLADVFELNDLILEIENKSLTHRPDCFGIIGFAREVAGVLGAKFEPARILAETSVKKAFSATRAITISISSPNICQRYTALILEKHGEMKAKYLTWVDTVLSKSGMKPISPIVDATNYLMLLTGQPLHAFDYDKFVAVGGKDKPEIVVRLARAGEKLILLDDTEVELNENDIVICSGETPVALAGAMGGKSTMIDENTKNIILESATFSLYNLRKTQMAHGIFSEAVTRFTKGQPPYQTLAVAEACAEMLADGFKVTGGADEYPQPERPNAVDRRSSVGRRFEEENKFSSCSSPTTVKITTEEINGLLGTDYDEKSIAQTLENVGFGVKSKRNELEILAPLWRTDIHIKEDITEEVGRLNGYDNIEPTLPLHATAEKNEMWELKKQIRNTLARFGANEVLTYSFVSGRLLERVGQDVKNSYRIVNSISPELQYIRQSLTPSLLEKTYLNEKLPVEKFAIFEMNQVYCKEWGVDAEKVPAGRMKLGLVVAERKNPETAFYKAKLYAAKLFSELNISAEFVPIKRVEAESKPYEPKRTAEILIDGEYVGVVGEFKNSVRSEFKLAPYVAGFEIDLELVKNQARSTREIKFGAKKKEDVTITTDRTYAEVLRELKDKYPEATITPGTIYQAPGQKNRNITFHIEY
ncbi:phenylalanine--tRNA ligase subunit beta [Candidatus Saccharibacteria bacterium]|nr:phenylalanine--tRNA ligase subunit beta [Candidatus Saccharibacteria bacterium]